MLCTRKEEHYITIANDARVVSNTSIRLQNITFVNFIKETYTNLYTFYNKCLHTKLQMPVHHE